MSPHIEQATAADAALVASVLLEAAEWLIATGRPMWKLEEITASSLRSDVALGLYFVARSGRKVSGTVKFQLADPVFWPDVSKSESAFIHRLAVRRRFAGTGVSRALIKFAIQRASDLGCRFLRLDCAIERHGLRRFYEAQGFRHHSNFVAGPWQVARYELPVSLVDTRQ